MDLETLKKANELDNEINLIKIRVKEMDKVIEINSEDGGYITINALSRKRDTRTSLSPLSGNVLISIMLVQIKSLLEARLKELEEQLSSL